MILSERRESAIQKITPGNFCDFRYNSAVNQHNREIKNKVVPSESEPLVELKLTDVLQALSDPVRLHIVKLSAERERACCEFELDIPKATLSHHFKVLREAGVILVRADGTRHLTSVNRRQLDTQFPGLLKSVLSAMK